MALPDATTVADRWVQGAAVGQTRYTEGVQATTKDPTALAIAAIPKMQANFLQAVQSGRVQRGLQKVGKAGWQAATVAKAANYGTGIAASKDKYVAAMQVWLPIIAQAQAQVQAMPNATIQDSIARSAAMQLALHNAKLAR